MIVTPRRVILVEEIIFKICFLANLAVLITGAFLFLVILILHLRKQYLIKKRDQLLEKIGD